MDNQDQVAKLQREWEQRRKLDARKDALAKHVYDLVNRQRRETLPNPAQLQNLRSLAASTDSLEELKIYIWYQMTRAGRPIPPEFGRPLVSVVETLAQEEFAVEQVRLFLGYLYRYARYYARDNQPRSNGPQRQSGNRSGGNR